jgi:hypothetical protein
MSAYVDVFDQSQGAVYAPSKPLEKLFMTCRILISQQSLLLSRFSADLDKALILCSKERNWIRSLERRGEASFDLLQKLDFRQAPAPDFKSLAASLVKLGSEHS